MSSAPDFSEQQGPPPAYGHPATAFAHVFFKVGPPSASRTLSLACVVVPTDRVLLQVASIVVFVIARLFGAGYVLNFVITVLLLMLDFWTVRSCLSKQLSSVLLPTILPGCWTSVHALQTKNISGRLLVGLRWWNEVTDEGSNWRFETLEEVPPGRPTCCRRP